MTVLLNYLNYITMKRIDETKEGQSISAIVILNKKKERVCTVRAHYSDAGVCRVEVHNIGEDVQTGRASGYGYDKRAAALRGLNVDGHLLYDHCGQNDQTKKIIKMYQKGTLTREQAEKRAKKIGADFANWDSKAQKWSSLYLRDGLDRINMLGYTVIQAI